jgi:hypothetical protein
LIRAHAPPLIAGWPIDAGTEREIARIDASGDVAQ